MEFYTDRSSQRFCPTRSDIDMSALPGQENVSVAAMMSWLAADIVARPQVGAPQVEAPQVGALQVGAPAVLAVPHEMEKLAESERHPDTSWQLASSWSVRLAPETTPNLSGTVAALVQPGFEAPPRPRRVPRVAWQLASPAPAPPAARHDELMAQLGLLANRLAQMPTVPPLALPAPDPVIAPAEPAPMSRGGSLGEPATDRASIAAERLQWLEALSGHAWQQAPAPQRSKAAASATAIAETIDRIRAMMQHRRGSPA